MQYLIGIDDTDNKETRGTGFRARELAVLINKHRVAKVFGVTRHQLFIHDDIPYTSHNSSACLYVESDKIKDVIELSKDFLIRIAAAGCNIALCVAKYNEISKFVLQWGQRCKVEVVKQSEAWQLAKRENIFLESYTGTKSGVIGALAAIGLRASGNDGRFIWLKGKELRKYPEIASVQELKENSGIEIVIDKNKITVRDEDRIFTGKWMRPVLKDNKKVLFVDRILNEKDYEWTVADKDYIKAFSD